MLSRIARHFYFMPDLSAMILTTASVFRNIYSPSTLKNQITVAPYGFNSPYYRK